MHEYLGLLQIFFATANRRCHRCDETNKRNGIKRKHYHQSLIVVNINHQLATRTQKQANFANAKKKEIRNKQKYEWCNQLLRKFYRNHFVNVLNRRFILSER